MNSVTRTIDSPNVVLAVELVCKAPIQTNKHKSDFIADVSIKFSI